MNFHTIFEKLQQLPERDIGLVVIDAVMANRIDLNGVYRAGNTREFRNREMGRVLRQLERLRNGEKVIGTPTSLADLYVESRLGKYRTITSLCFMYDVIKLLFQNYTGNPIEKIVAIAEFTGPRIRSASLKPPFEIPYQREKESPVPQYLRILSSMKNALEERTGLILQRGF